MSLDLYRTLGWLPPAPADFSQRCRALSEAPEQAGRRIRALATHALSEPELVRLGRAMAQLRRARANLSPLAPFRLGILGNGTLDLMIPLLEASAARHGIALECVHGAYDQFMQDALDAGSVINQTRPDAILLALDHRGLALRPSPGDPAASDNSVENALDLLATLRQAIQRNCGATCIIQTLAPPPEGLFGSLDRAIPGTARSLVDAVNRRIVAMVAGTQDVILDVAGIAETIGLAEWHSPLQWNMAKLPFADGCVPLYADHVGRLLGALRGRSRRCLVLDLDNTIWGGVIGDDGMAGILLAQGDATGEAHLSVQALALALRARGIVLAVSSKNTDSVARQPFIAHPDMLLREEHIAVFQANWNDKASNLRAIAEELSLGLDALVFLDDNPAERELIRRELPEVAVPELDADPANYARILAAAGYFEAVRFSPEDRARADMYQDNARRLTLQKQAGDMESYLRSLDMRIVFRSVDPPSRARVAQLISKSNQFNLTTRRTSEAELARIEADPDVMTLHARLIDKFGDNGIICVVICRIGKAADEWVIDTWLMSCRVLGRRVEQMVLREIIGRARARGIRRLIGIYRPTERNAMVRDHYAGLGFTPLGDAEDGGTAWELSTAVEVEAGPARVDRDGVQVQAA